MLELTLQFSPADGSAPRPITVRISDVRQTGVSWSAQVDVLGFAPDCTTRIHGVDWAQAIELAARFVAMECSERGGRLDPPLYPPLPAAAGTGEGQKE